MRYNNRCSAHQPPAPRSQENERGTHREWPTRGSSSSRARARDRTPSAWVAPRGLPVLPLCRRRLNILCGEPRFEREHRKQQHARDGLHGVRSENGFEFPRIFGLDNY